MDSPPSRTQTSEHLNDPAAQENRNIVINNTIKFYKASQDSYGIYPYRKSRRFWEYAMLLVSTISLMELPFDWVFNFDRTAAYVLPALALDAFYFADLYVVYHTGVLIHGVVRTDKETIVKSFKLGKKIVYWIVPWPFYLIGFLIHNNIVYDILVGIKLLRFLRLHDAYYAIRNKIIVYGAISRMYALFCFLLIIIQYFACIFWATAYYEHSDKTWLKLTGTDQYSKFSQYLRTFYYITTTVLTIGYGDIHPFTLNEMCVVIFIELIGVIYYNFFLSTMVSIIADPVNSEFFKRFKSLYTTLRSQGLTNTSLHEVLTYYEYVWDKDKNRTEFFDAASKLPLALQKKLELALHMEVFNSVDALRNKPEAALEKVAISLQPRIFSPSEILLRAGHVSRRMLFITNGKMSAYSAQGSLLQTLDGAKGCVLGEPSLILGRSETATIIAETFVEAFELTKEDYDDIPEIHPPTESLPNNPILSSVARIHL